MTAAEGMHMEYWVAGLIGGAAAVEDLMRRTISNWTSAAALAAGLACQSLVLGWHGVGAALLGAAAGFAVFLAFYMLGGMGGGDVKLMAGFGAMLGVARVWQFALWTAFCGGILAVAALGVAALMARFRLGPAGSDNNRPVAIPYAPAIVLGLWLTLLSSQ